MRCTLLLYILFVNQEDYFSTLMFTFAICYRPSVCRLLSVEIFGNISTAFGTFRVPNAVEILPKISTDWVGCTSVTDRRTVDSI